ncbi:MAG: hypothetical protein QXE81_04895 [Desulfurococcaceae archaeon]
MSEPKPIYGLGLFLVRETGLIEQFIEFCYLDPGETYAKIMKDRDQGKKEKTKLARNMQTFLDQEEVLINNQRVYPKVIDVEIGFREDFKHPYIVFFIVFTGILRHGLNIYEDKYNSELVEYNYRVYWIFPSKARVIKADLGVPYILLNNGRILAFSVNKGSEIRGYERIEFEIIT